MKKSTNLKTSFLLALTLLLLFSFDAAAQPKKGAAKNQPATAAKTNAGKITMLLDKSVGQYTKLSDTVWTVAYQGETIGDFDLIVATAPGTELVVISAILAKKKDLRVTEDLLYKLLQYNNTADYVKVGFDDQDDLFLRAELNLRLIDQKEFKTVIEQVAAAASQLHEQISGSIKAESKQ